MQKNNFEELTSDVKKLFSKTTENESITTALNAGMKQPEERVKLSGKTFRRIPAEEAKNIATTKASQLQSEVDGLHAMLRASNTATLAVLAQLEALGAELASLREMRARSPPSPHPVILPPALILSQQQNSLRAKQKGSGCDRNCKLI